MPVSYKEISFEEVIKILRESEKKFSNQIYYASKEVALLKAIDYRMGIEEWIKCKFFIKVEE